MASNRTGRGGPPQRARMRGPPLRTQLAAGTRQRSPPQPLLRSALSLPSLLKLSAFTTISHPSQFLPPRLASPRLSSRSSPPHFSSLLPLSCLLLSSHPLPPSLHVAALCDSSSSCFQCGFPVLSSRFSISPASANSDMLCELSEEPA